ncbi:hypothetical protein [Ligilactobacillus salivarius]|uniref:Uncharacterized protein n=2 Tax=Ligilactobacillus salivarius TaxID=1624 RepID=A0ABD7YY49_9LACO|nr:hypothetical protein [Ligilactobacillus salivarius]WHS07207.1 hypothetical protein O2U05_00285 [Ligilactobacillus salivarius]WHS10974.1 hypothetical protein O2U04_09990 [Ligilactobacillus salivarius]WHS15387.1 hypothetical protein O2U03_10845 [Ligilactobacillus salivarius]WHS18796.1 hypothetical protein O2U02_11000 [Ligilactobacillus salivarius]WNB35189.1 hypothetical protein O2U09_10940 [Ligilactobacillus salivarius]
MSLITKRREARLSILKMTFSKRNDLEEWINNNLVVGTDNTISSDEIMGKIDIKNISSNAVNWFLFNKDGTNPVEENNQVLWNVSLKQKDSPVEENNEKQTSENNDQQSNDDISEISEKQVLFSDLTDQEKKVYRSRIEKLESNTIQESKLDKKNWIGLRIWLTKKGFKDTTSGLRYPLSKIMNYYNYDKPDKPITYEMLRDRLIFDGFIETETDRSLENHYFNISNPSPKYRAAFIKSQG